MVVMVGIDVHKDTHCAVAVDQVGVQLGGAGVNIASAQVGRDKQGGQALMAVTVDEAVPADVLDLLLADEVVGQLDTATAADVMDMIITASRERSLTVLYP